MITIWQKNNWLERSAVCYSELP